MIVDVEFTKPNNDGESEYSIIGEYNKPIKIKNFEFTPIKSDSFTKTYRPFTFRFVSEKELIATYTNRIYTKLKEEDGTALVISIHGDNPIRDRDYLDYLLDEFQAYNLDLKNKQADLTINFLTKQIKIINDSLQRARVELDKFQKTTGIYEITSPSLRKEIGDADKEKESLNILERSLLILTQNISESILGDSKIITPTELGVENTILNSLISEYNNVIESSKYLGAKNPMFNKRIDELNGIRRRILKELNSAQSLLQKQKDFLIKKYQLLDLKVDNLPQQERDYLRFEREYQVNEMYHQFLTQKRYEAQIQKESNTPDNFTLEFPEIKGGANNASEKQKNYAFWIIIALLVPIGFVVFAEEIFNYTISTKEECEKLSGLPVIGTVENISSKLKDGAVLVKNYPKSSFAESFRNIRVRLSFMTKREEKYTVLITSAEPADGKTFISTNIASVFQLMNKKVVLIDLDLRRPSVANTLKIDNREIGVSNYLINQVSLDDIIFTHPDYGFDVIPAGTLPPNPSELIKTDRTKELIELLQEKYDFVIIDCSPVGLVSDAYILAKMVDTTLFAVRRAKTNKAFFKSVVGQMKFDGIENIALVFNDVKGREGYYGTSRYYGDRTYYLKKNSYYHDDYFED